MLWFQRRIGRREVWGVKGGTLWVQDIVFEFEVEGCGCIRCMGTIIILEGEGMGYQREGCVQWMYGCKIWTGAWV